MDPTLFLILRITLFVAMLGGPIAYIFLRARSLKRKGRERKLYQPFAENRRWWPYIEKAFTECAVAVLGLSFGWFLISANNYLNANRDALTAQDFGAIGGLFVSTIVMGFVAFTYLNGTDSLRDNRLEAAPILDVAIHENGACVVVTNMTDQPAYAVNVTLKSQWRPGHEKPSPLASSGLLPPNASRFLQVSDLPRIEEDDALRIEWKSFADDAYGREYPLDS